MHFDQRQGVFEHSDVEGTAPQVEDQGALEFLLVQAVGHGGGGRFVDQALHLEARQLGGEHGALALFIAEIGRHRNHRLVHRAAQKGLGVVLQRAQHQGRELFGAECLPAQLQALFAAHETLECRDAAIGVGGQSRTGGAPHQDAAVVIDTDHRGGKHLAKGIRDQLGTALLPYGDQAVGGAQVNAQQGRGGGGCILHMRSLAVVVIGQRPELARPAERRPTLTEPPTSTNSECTHGEKGLTCKKTYL